MTSANEFMVTLLYNGVYFDFVLTVESALDSTISTLL